MSFIKFEFQRILAPQRPVSIPQIRERQTQRAEELCDQLGLQSTRWQAVDVAAWGDSESDSDTSTILDVNLNPIPIPADLAAFQ